MSTDCGWFNSKLENYFGDGLDEAESRLAREHLAQCDECAREVNQLRAVDPMLRHVLNYRLAVAAAAHNSRPSATNTRVLKFALAGVAVLLLAVLALGSFFGSPERQMAESQISAPAAATPVAEDKSSETPLVDRAKPDPAAAVFPLPLTDEPVQEPAGTADFAVIDAAGYATSLENYRGFVLVFGAWSADQREAAGRLQEIHNAFRGDPGVRILGVAANPQVPTEDLTFTVVFNHGSRLLDVKNGEYMVVDGRGIPRSHGALTGDETVVPRLQALVENLK